MLRNDYSPREIDGTKCIWLQSVGWRSAKPAGELKEGDVVYYNHGYTGTVVSIDRETKKTIFYTVEENGKLYAVKRRKATLVATR